MKNIERIIQIIILLTIITYSQFYKLGTLPYRIWDESRQAQSAYEMSKTGDLLVVTVGYNPELWSTKPPLLIWMQAVCIKLHGLNEYSVRFPAAACAALTIIFIFLFVGYVSGNGWIGLVAATVLCTAKGYIDYHGSRYGEYDAPLTLFTTCYLLAFFMFTEEQFERRKNIFLLLFFGALTLAALTKSIAALLFLPSLFIYALFRKKVIPILTNRYFYLGAVGFLFFVIGYYLLREHYNAGYIQAVFNNELGGRFLNANEDHKAPFNFYFHNLRWLRFGSWHWVLITGLLLLPLQENAKTFRLLVYNYLCAALFLLTLSTSETKLWWYDLPTYPLFAIIIALSLFQLCKLIAGAFTLLNRKVVLLAVCLLASAQPVYEVFQMIRYTYDDLNNDTTYAASYYLRDAAYQKKDLNGVVYFATGYSLPYKLYVDELSEKGIHMTKEDYTANNSFTSGQVVLAHQSETKNFIETNYSFKVKEEFYDVRLYEITDKKL